MKKPLPNPLHEIRQEIDELGGIPSERPSQVDFKISFGSIHPPKSRLAGIIAVVVALGAIAEVLHEVLK